jgi:hypothetical protein
VGVRACRGGLSGVDGTWRPFFGVVGGRAEDLDKYPDAKDLGLPSRLWCLGGRGHANPLALIPNSSGCIFLAWLVIYPWTSKTDVGLSMVNGVFS